MFEIILQGLSDDEILDVAAAPLFHSRSRMEGSVKTRISWL